MAEPLQQLLQLQIVTPLVRFDAATRKNSSKYSLLTLSAMQIA